MFIVEIYEGKCKGHFIYLKRNVGNNVKLWIVSCFDLVTFHCLLCSCDSVTRLVWVFHWKKAPKRKWSVTWFIFMVRGREKEWNLRRKVTAAWANTRLGGKTRSVEEGKTVVGEHLGWYNRNTRCIQETYRAAYPGQPKNYHRRDCIRSEHHSPKGTISNSFRSKCKYFIAMQQGNMWTNCIEKVAQLHRKIKTCLTTVWLDVLCLNLHIMKLPSVWGFHRC